VILKEKGPAVAASDAVTTADSVPDAPPANLVAPLKLDLERDQPGGGPAVNEASRSSSGSVPVLWRVKLILHDPGTVALPEPDVTRLTWGSTWTLSSFLTLAAQVTPPCWWVTDAAVTFIAAVESANAVEPLMVVVSTNEAKATVVRPSSPLVVLTTATVRGWRDMKARIEGSPVLQEGDVP
jgi:hypothetical protein